MEKFLRLKGYSDDELIFLVYEDNQNWQKEAVDYAQELLLERGITDEFAQFRIKQIRKEIKLLEESELEQRNQESFDVIDLFFMTLFWYRYIFVDWYLNRDGYAKKRKQRLYAIGTGIFLTSILILYVDLTHDKEEQQIMQEIIQKDRTDRIEMSKIDWSGLYIFLDTTIGQTEKLIWELEVKKINMEHSAVLKLIDNKETLRINCVGLVKKDGFEFFPDTTYLLFNGETISYYDRLFSFVRIDNDIYTDWGKMRPFYHLKFNDSGLFKKVSVSNLHN